MNHSPILPRALEERKKAGRQRGPRVNERFRAFANTTARAVGTPWAFFAAMLLIVLWATSYRFFVHGKPGTPEYQEGFDTWQLVINTATTIVTFLMVFLIQNTQNRDAKAVHLKLDELIRGLEGPRTQLVDLEHFTDEELDKLEREFKRIHRREARRAGAEERNGHAGAFRVEGPPTRSAGGLGDQPTSGTLGEGTG